MSQELSFCMWQKEACSFVTTMGLQTFPGNLSSGNDHHWTDTDCCHVCPKSGWAPWLKLLIEEKCKWRGQDGVTSHFENLLFSHSGSWEFSLFGPRFLYLFLAWLFLHFLKDLVIGYIWLSFEVSKWAKESRSQTGAEIIHSLVFVQHSSRRPWLGCLVLPETKQNKRSVNSNLYCLKD